MRINGCLWPLVAVAMACVLAVAGCATEPNEGVLPGKALEQGDSGFEVVEHGVLANMVVLFIAPGITNLSTKPIRIVSVAPVTGFSDAVFTGVFRYTNSADAPPVGWSGDPAKERRELRPYVVAAEGLELDPGESVTSLLLRFEVSASPALPQKASGIEVVYTTDGRAYFERFEEEMEIR